MKSKARLEKSEHSVVILCDICPDPEYRFEPCQAVDENGDPVLSGYPCYMWNCSTEPECEHLASWETDEEGCITIECASEAWGA